MPNDTCMMDTSCETAAGDCADKELVLFEARRPNVKELSNRAIAKWWISLSPYRANLLPETVIGLTAGAMISLAVQGRLRTHRGASTVDWLEAPVRGDDSRPFLALHDLDIGRVGATRKSPHPGSSGSTAIPIVNWDKDVTPEWDEAKADALRVLREFYGATDADS